MQIDRIQPSNPQISAAIKAASDATGTPFDYLVATAYRESTFQPDLKASTSTATGMYQFIEQQWLELVKQEGPALGLGNAAAATSEQNGRFTVADPQARQQILDLRKDPALASVMAGKVTARNEAYLTRAIGRTPSQQDLYVAHVMGPAGGAKLIRMAEQTPTAAAATAFPAAAAANQAIFYGRDGQAKSAAEVYQFLARSHEARPLPSETADLRLRAARSTETGTPRVSPAALADIVRAQAAADVSRTGILGVAASGTDMKAVRTAIGQTSLPGEASGATAPSGANLQGWRARLPSDAFSALLRTDTAAGQGPQLATGGALGYADIATGGAALQARAPQSGPLAFGRTGASMAAAGAAASGPPVSAATRAEVRPSRLVAARAQGGAPEAPLPMVTSRLGVERPSRFSMAAMVEAGLGGTSRITGAASATPAIAARTTARPVADVAAATAGATTAGATSATAATVRNPVRLEPISILPSGTTDPAALASATTAGRDAASRSAVAASRATGQGTLFTTASVVPRLSRSAVPAATGATAGTDAATRTGGVDATAPAADRVRRPVAPLDLTRYMPR